MTEFTSIGRSAPGFTRPGYGLGVMLDPEHPGGALIGHGGGGPGCSAGAFVLMPPEGRPIVSVVLSAGHDGGAQETALALLAAV